jgi:hypothetical protein
MWSVHFIKLPYLKVQPPQTTICLSLTRRSPPITCFNNNNHLNLLRSPLDDHNGAGHNNEGKSPFFFFFIIIIFLIFNVQLSFDYHLDHLNNDDDDKEGWARDMDASRVSGSVEQGFGKPQGYKGKGKEGKGQGTDSITLNKP